MNKILAALCGVGLAALAAVVAYILIHKDPAVEQEPLPNHPSPSTVETTMAGQDYRF